MKKFIIFILLALGILYISDRLYKQYRYYYLTDDRAVLFVYINIKNDDISKYFNLKIKEFDSKKNQYRMRCVVPDYEHLNLINYRTNYDLNLINCNEDYNFETQFELKKEYIKYYTLRIELLDNKNKIIAHNDISTFWNFGKVNHIVVEKNRVYKYCSK